MDGARLAAVLSRHLKRPVEGLVLRRAVGGRITARRVGPEEPIDLETYSEVIALVSFTRAEVLSTMQKGHERVPRQQQWREPAYEVAKRARCRSAGSVSRVHFRGIARCCRTGRDGDGYPGAGAAARGGT